MEIILKRSRKAEWNEIWTWSQKIQAPELLVSENLEEKQTVFPFNIIRAQDHPKIISLENILLIDWLCTDYLKTQTKCFIFTHKFLSSKDVIGAGVVAQW